MLSQETILDLVNVEYKMWEKGEKEKKNQKSKQWQGFISYTSGKKWKEINIKIKVRFLVIFFHNCTEF